MRWVAFLLVVFLGGCGDMGEDVLEGYDEVGVDDVEKIEDIVNISVGRSVTEEGSIDDGIDDGVAVEVVNGVVYMYLSNSVIWGNRDNVSRRIVENIYGRVVGVQGVQVVWYEDRHDIYGHPYEKEVNEVYVSRDTSKKINWERFKSENLSEVADEYRLNE